MGRLRQCDYTEYVELFWGICNASGMIKWGEPELCRLDSAVRSVLAECYKRPDNHRFMIVRAKRLKAITTYKAALELYENDDFPKD